MSSAENRRNRRSPLLRAAVVTVAAAMLFIAAAPWRPAEALPANARLFHKRYGYPVNCALCHTQGGGSALNGYGRDFLRAGMNYGAFERIEETDSDDDGEGNLEEIRARSNPGTAASTPGDPGDWLQGLAGVAIPQDALLAIFPDALSFSALEGTLDAKQVEDVSERLGEPLAEEDTVPTFYFPFRRDAEDAPPRKYGVATFATAPGDQGPIIVGVGTDTRARVVRVVLAARGGYERIGDDSFLAQFVGLGPRSSFEVGEDGAIRPAEGEEAASSAVATAVRKALLTLTEVFAARRRDAGR